MDEEFYGVGSNPLIESGDFRVNLQDGVTFSFSDLTFDYVKRTIDFPFTGQNVVQRTTLRKLWRGTYEFGIRDNDSDSLTALYKINHILSEGNQFNIMLPLHLEEDWVSYPVDIQVNRSRRGFVGLESRSFNFNKLKVGRFVCVLDGNNITVRQIIGTDEANDRLHLDWYPDNFFNQTRSRRIHIRFGSGARSYRIPAISTTDTLTWTSNSITGSEVENISFSWVEKL